MYNDDEERKGLPIKTFLISLLVIIILVLLLIWLLPMPNLKGINNRIFNANVSEMKDAATSYFTTDKLPQEEGDSVKLTLQEMLDKKLLLPFTDKNGDSCDTEKSYVLLTKKKDSYEMKVNLKCNEEEDYILVTMGCYSYCTSAICEDKTEKEKEEEKKEEKIGCSLYVASGSKSGSAYTSDIVVKFASKKSSSEITSYGIGLDNSYNGKDSYTVTNYGITTVRGVIKDKNGKVATCSLTVRKEKPVTPVPVAAGPSCTLVIDSNAKNGDYYTQDVNVKWGVKTSGSKITNYGISTSGVNYNGNDTFKVTNDGTTTVYGYVKDSSGKTATCSVVVNKDSSKPNCSVYVVSGSKANNGSYISDVVVGLSKSDSTSGVLEYGISNNSTVVYNNTDRYTITTNGTHKIYGYIKDNAGNTNVCSITVKRNIEETPEKVSVPSCTLNVVSGTKGQNDWYLSNVTVGFDQMTTTNGASITSYGLGKVENYNGNKNYIILHDGTSTVYGYVKDSNNNTAVCSIKVKKDTAKPTCLLKVREGSIDSDGYYSSDVVVGFSNIKDTTSGIAGYGIGKSVNYNKGSISIINTVGSHTIYGYVKDNAGNENTCSIEVTKKSATEYQYKKNVSKEYSSWSDWSTYTYSTNNKPQFGNYELIEIVDLGKSRVVDHYEYSKGDPIYKNALVKVGTIKQSYCSNYSYYRTTTTTTTTRTTTYAVSNSSSWKSVGRVTTKGSPTDTLAVKYEFVGFDWSDCSGCITAPKKVWNKYSRTGVGVATDSDTVATSSTVSTKCDKTELKDVEIFATAKQLVGYEEVRTPIYKDVYNYKRRTRTIVKDGYTDYKWGTYNDESLINQGYTMTGNTRVVN